MSVYVDNIRTPFRRMIMSHLLADTVAELMKFAADLGLKPEWLQRSRQGIPHFDICQSKREQAIKRGAVVISGRTLLRIMNRLRQVSTNKEKNHETDRVS